MPHPPDSCSGFTGRKWGVVDEPVRMVRVRKLTHCACGEPLGPGDRAGLVGERGTLRCSRCLADLQAGREPPRRRRAVPTKKHRGRSALVLVLVVLLAVGAFYARSLMAGSDDGWRVPGTDLVIGRSTAASKSSAGGIPASWPPVPSDASATPLGRPPGKASSSTEFAFIHTVDGPDGTRPVAWDPCRPVHLVVNNAHAPTGSDKLLREATARISSATGLQFVIDGPTTEAPSTDRKTEDKKRYGNTWSPVLVAWTDPATVPQLKGSVAGLAGPDGAPYFETAQEHWVSGSVNLDGPQLSDALRRPAGWNMARAIVMHELGHLVGLEHVTSRSELMYAETTGRTDFGPGDREGLRQLGLGHCFGN